MSFPIIDIIAEMKEYLFGHLGLTIVFGILVLFLIMSQFRVPKTIMVLLISPLLFIFAKYYPWLYIVGALIIGFPLAKAFIRLFNQES